MVALLACRKLPHRSAGPDTDLRVLVRRTAHHADRQCRRGHHLRLQRRRSGQCHLSKCGVGRRHPHAPLQRVGPDRKRVATACPDRDHRRERQPLCQLGIRREPACGAERAQPLRHRYRGPHLPAVQRRRSPTAWARCATTSFPRGSTLPGSPRSTHPMMAAPTRTRRGLTTPTASRFGQESTGKERQKDPQPESNQGLIRDSVYEEPRLGGVSSQSIPTRNLPVIGRRGAMRTPWHGARLPGWGSRPGIAPRTHPSSFGPPPRCARR